MSLNLSLILEKKVVSVCFGIENTRRIYLVIKLFYTRVLRFTETRNWSCTLKVAHKQHSDRHFPDGGLRVCVKMSKSI